jgi:transposase
MANAQYRLSQIIKDVKSGDFKYIPKEDKPIDWASYTEAQLNEMNDYLVLAREIIDEIHREIGDIDKGNVGKPPKSCFNLAKAVMIQQYFETSNRVTAGLIKILREKMRIDEELTYKDIERAYENPSVILVLNMLFTKTNEPVIGRETEFTGDGTGISTTIKENYANDRDDIKKMKIYDRMIGVVGVEYKLLSAVEITDGESNECPFLIPLLTETNKTHKHINLVSLDGAYYSHDNISFIASIGAVPRIMPPIDAAFKSYGCMAKKKMLIDFMKNTQKWLEEYHTRSISESRNSSDKRVFTRNLLKRIDCRRYTEGFARACRYNVRRLVVK